MPHRIAEKIGQSEIRRGPVSDKLLFSRQYPDPDLLLLRRTLHGGGPTLRPFPNEEALRPGMKIPAFHPG